MSRLYLFLQGELRLDHQEGLDAIGFQWVVKAAQEEEVWDTKYSELVDYHQKNGHCNVPARHPPNPALGSWVAWQRTVNNKVRNHLS